MSNIDYNINSNNNINNNNNNITNNNNYKSVKLSGRRKRCIDNFQDWWSKSKLLPKVSPSPHHHSSKPKEIQRSQSFCVRSDSPFNKYHQRQSLRRNTTDPSYNDIFNKNNMKIFSVQNDDKYVIENNKLKKQKKYKHKLLKNKRKNEKKKDSN